MAAKRGSSRSRGRATGVGPTVPKSPTGSPRPRRRSAGYTSDVRGLAGKPTRDVGATLKPSGLGWVPARRSR